MRSLAAFAALAVGFGQPEDVVANAVHQGGDGRGLVLADHGHQLLVRQPEFVDRGWRRSPVDSMSARNRG